MTSTERRWHLSGRLADLATTSPERTFLRFVDVEDSPSETYGETYEAVTRWAGMVRGLGVAPGEFVATMLSEPRACLHSWFGINAARAAEVPIHTDYRGDYLAHVLNTTAARVAIVAASYLERFEEIADQVPSLERVAVVGPEPAVRLPWPVATSAELLATAPALDESALLRDGDVCSVLFTSGTTGASKGVLVPFAHLRATVEGAWPAGDLGAEDRYYSMLPLHHVGGKVAVGAMLQAGGQLVLRERFKTTAFWSDVRGAGATCVCLTGSMTGFLLGEPASPGDTEHQLRKALILPLPRHLDEFRDRFGVEVRTVYNQTEISSPIRSDGYDTRDYRLSGRPRPGAECRIVDENDDEVTQGEIGELVVRTDEPWTMMAGYLGMPEKTTEAWRNLWLHTGDAFRQDDGGNFQFVDRLNDTIRRRGENISSVELEASTCGFPAVAECAAVGVKAEFDEEEVKVCVVPKPGMTVDPAELVEFLEGRVPRFMVPRYVEVLGELPRTPTQKIRKAELRRSGITATVWDRGERRSQALPKVGPA
jgi:crotonobetaine/carnitine-CoA ligase